VALGGEIVEIIVALGGESVALGGESVALGGESVALGVQVKPEQLDDRGSRPGYINFKI